MTDQADNNGGKWELNVQTWKEIHVLGGHRCRKECFRSPVIYWKQTCPSDSCVAEKFFVCAEYLVNLTFCILKWRCEYTHSHHSCVNNCSSGAVGMKFLRTSDLEGNNVTVTLYTLSPRFLRGLGRLWWVIYFFSQRHKFGGNTRGEVSFRVHVGRERVNESDWSRGMERSVQDFQMLTIHN